MNRTPARPEPVEGRSRSCFDKLSTNGLALFLIVILSVSGCGWKSRRVIELEQQTAQLQGQLTEAERTREGLLQSLEKARADLSDAQRAHAREVERLMAEREKSVRRVEQEKTEEANELVEAQRRLAESLKKELGQAQAKLAMTERGLVLTFLDEIFFDSGKAVIILEAAPVLEKVAAVLKETVPDSPVAVEGHTDNEPIKYSGWRSNWELSSARALAVVHHFIDKEGLSPERVRAVGFGEYHPVASNDTPEGRRQNRRVEIVILPKILQKVKEKE